MQELLEAIEHVRNRITHYRDQLSKNEMLTRYVLIDPILRALGWDTADPTQVIPEFSMQQNRADYALLYDDKPLVMVEAKSLGSSLHEARKQGVNGAVSLGVRYFICTDGDTWEVYDALQPKPLEEKRIVHTKLSSDALGDASRQLLALWRPAMPTVQHAPGTVIPQPEPKLRLPRGVSLSELQRKVGARQESPKRLILSDGTIKELHSWRDLLIEVARWALPKLKQENALPLGKLIVSNPKTSKAPKPVGQGWHVKTHFSARNCVHEACRILKTAHSDPGQVFVDGWQPHKT